MDILTIIITCILTMVCAFATIIFFRKALTRFTHRIAIYMRIIDIVMDIITNLNDSTKVYAQLKKIRKDTEFNTLVSDTLSELSN